MTTYEQIQPALAAPFPPEVVSGDSVSVSAIQDRLDRVLGIGGWHTQFHEIDFRAWGCEILIKVESELVAREGVGAGPTPPAACDEAFRAAARAFGVGRYLLLPAPGPVVTVNPASPEQRQEITDHLATADMGIPVSLPPPAPPPEPAPNPLPDTGEQLLTRLRAKERDLVRSGLCFSGELVAYVEDKARGENGPKKVHQFTEPWIHLTVKWCKEFESAARLAREEALAPGPAIGDEQAGLLLALFERKGRRLEDWARYAGAEAGVDVLELSQHQADCLTRLLEEQPDSSVKCEV